MRWLVGPLLQEIALVFAQDPTEVLRLTQAGFAPETIFNLGSLKYDVAALDTAMERDISAWWDRTGWTADQPILLGGSTHPARRKSWRASIANCVKNGHIAAGACAAARRTGNSIASYATVWDCEP